MEQPSAGVVERPGVKAQRRPPAGIRVQGGTPGLYLKAPRGHPGLYAGTGERWGGGIGVVVRAAALFSLAPAPDGQPRFTIHGGHLDDIERLRGALPVAWPEVLERARPLGLAVPVGLLLEGRRTRGLEVPAPPREPALRWRLAYAHRWVSPEL